MRVFTLLLLFVSIASTAAFAEPESIFNGPISLKIGQADHPIDVRLTAEAPDTELILQIDANAQQLYRAAEAALAKAIDEELKSNCEDRFWREPVSVSKADAFLRVSVGLRYERWFCGLGKTRLVRESVTLVALLHPNVENHRLNLVLRHFEITGAGALALALDAENRLRGDLQRAIGKVNADADFSKLPAPLRDEGFLYKDVAVLEESIRVILTGPDLGLPLLRIVRSYLLKTTE